MAPMAKRDHGKAIEKAFDAFGLDRWKPADWDTLLEILAKARPRKKRGAPVKWTPALIEKFNECVLQRKILTRLTEREFHDWFVSKLDGKAISSSASAALDAIIANPEFRARLETVPDKIARLDPGQRPHVVEASLILAGTFLSPLPLPPGVRGGPVRSPSAHKEKTLMKYIIQGTPATKRKK
jgi:hypothetical protein